MWDQEAPLRTLGAYLDDVVRDSMNREALPSELIEAARSATQRGMIGRVPNEIGPVDQRRVRAYFWRVIRQRSVRAKGAGVREFHQRAIAESLVRDLRESGREGSAIVRELELSCVVGQAPALVDEYRQALCG